MNFWSHRENWLRQGKWTILFQNSSTPILYIISTLKRLRKGLRVKYGHTPLEVRTGKVIIDRMTDWITGAMIGPDSSIYKIESFIYSFIGPPHRFIQCFVIDWRTLSFIQLLIQFSSTYRFTKCTIHLFRILLNAWFMDPPIHIPMTHSFTHLLTRPTTHPLKE